jgi:hypothetical protein
VEVKGIREPLLLYELHALTGRYAGRMPDSDAADVAMPVSLPLRCWVLEGKTVRGEAVPGEVIALGPRRLTARLTTPLPPLTNVRLRLRYPERQQDSADIYGKVLPGERAGAADALRVGLTWVEATDQRLLDALQAAAAASSRASSG